MHRSSLLATLLCCGCAVEALAPPEIAAVCRADDQAVCEDWAWAGAGAEIRIAGQGLHPAYEIDLGDDEAPRTGIFSARLGSMELEDVQLDVHGWSEQPALAARLPVALPLGSHLLEIETPGGQRAARVDAFRLENPLLLVLGADKLRLPRQDQLVLHVGLSNLGPAELSEVQLDWVQSGTGALLPPEHTEPIRLEAGQSTTVDQVWSASSPGRTQISIWPRGLAAGCVQLTASGPRTIDVEILEQASLTCAVRASEDRPRIGEGIELLVTASNPGGVAVQDVIVEQVETSGAGGLDLDASPSEVDLPASGHRTIRWTGTASQAGQIRLVLRIAGQEQISGRAIEAGCPPLELEIL
ncbi:MAG: hypothetical protein JXR96_04680 [Deltaproteobacteria bacterium]|nr:hypothetical protein [Deltaproteobacteria bacterium]